MKFWDASALIPLIVDTAETRSVRSLYGRDPEMRVWWGTGVECISTLQRRVRERMPTQDLANSAVDELRAVLEAAGEIAPTLEVRDRAERLLAGHALRAGDALRLGAALVWARERPGGHDFVCLDDRLRAAARREGYTILP